MVSNEEIRHLGQISKLELTDQEIQKYGSQIEEIIKYLDMLDSADLDEIEPLNLKKQFSELRKDSVQTFQDNALKNAKYRKDEFIKGPRLA